ncbi:MAG: arsenate reductase family protein [Chitinophagales bacterium]
MKKVYFLSTCSTCLKIIKEAGLEKKGFVFQNIKTENISPEQLDEMKNLIGSYEALFSRRSMKYKSMGLKDKKLTEKDYRDLILQEYTFLKRPVITSGKNIFAGSEKKTVELMWKCADVEMICPLIP